MLPRYFGLPELLAVCWVCVAPVATVGLFAYAGLNRKWNLLWAALGIAVLLVGSCIGIAVLLNRFG